MVVASLEGDTFNGRVRLNPSPIIISIEDNDPRPGTYIQLMHNPVESKTLHSFSYKYIKVH